MMPMPNEASPTACRWTWAAQKAPDQTPSYRRQEVSRMEGCLGRVAENPLAGQPSADKDRQAEKHPTRIRPAPKANGLRAAARSIPVIADTGTKGASTGSRRSARTLFRPCARYAAGER